jgi:hypothetical protein
LQSSRLDKRPIARVYPTNNKTSLECTIGDNINKYSTNLPIKKYQMRAGRPRIFNPLQKKKMLSDEAEIRPQV